MLRTKQDVHTRPRAIEYSKQDIHIRLHVQDYAMSNKEKSLLLCLLLVSSQRLLEGINGRKNLDLYCATLWVGQSSSNQLRDDPISAVIEFQTSHSFKNEYILN